MIIIYFSILTANSQTSVLFLLGMEVTLSNDERYQTLTEQSTYGDIIEVGGLTEHYNNLTLKTMYTLKFFLQEGKLK